MPQTLKRLLVLTLPSQWRFKSVPEAGGCCVGPASTLPLCAACPHTCGTGGDLELRRAGNNYSRRGGN